MGCPPVCKIIHSLKLVDYLHVQENNPWYKTFFSYTLHYDLSINGDLLWTLFKRGDVSSNWNLSFSSATKYNILGPEIFFLPKQTVHTMINAA